MTYFYDAWNRLASAKDNRVAAQGGSSNPTTYGYDATGNLTGYLYPNTVQTTNLFDPLNRLTQTCSATSSPACSAGTKLSSYLHGLAPAGNRLSVTELNGRLVSYGYDNDYRLTSEAISTDPAGNNGTVSYGPNGYDAVGNRVFMSSSLNAVPGGTFSYDVNDRLATDIYDANGSTISQAGIPNTYDFENRMLTHGGVTLVYDGDGNRVSETIGGVTTKFLVDDHNPTGLPQVLDEILSGAVTRTYAHGFQRISENQLISGTWTPSFYGYDGHGNVRFLTSSVGTITDTYQYDAFGMQIARTGTTPNVFQYSGEWLDSNVGLYYLRARYLNQATGRFWARDPVEGKKCCGLSWNPYIYVKDNAVNSVDPTGRATFTAPQPGLRGAIGGAIGEYTALLQNVSIRVFIISQITIPAYLQTPQGKALVALTLTGVSIAVHYNCGFIELTNWLTDFLEDLSGPNVRGPGLYCNEQPHDYEGEGK